MKLIPDDWRLLRGLARALLVILVFAAVFSLIGSVWDVRFTEGWPIWAIAILVLGVPVAFAAAGIVAARRLKGTSRWAAVAWSTASFGALAFALYVGYMALQLRDIFYVPSCGPRPADCRSLVKEKLGEVAFLLPPDRIGDYTFQSGESSETAFLFIYLEPAAREYEPLLLAVSPQMTGSATQPPSDPELWHETPGGIRFAERIRPTGVLAIDTWSGGSRFTVQFPRGLPREDPRYSIGMQLLDSILKK